MSSKYLNTTQILRVSIFPAERSGIFSWWDAVPEKKFLWFVVEEAREAGWYEYRYGERVTEEWIFKESSYAKQLFKKKDEPLESSIWRKPCVKIESVGGKYTNEDNVFFDSQQEAEEFTKELCEKFPHIKIV